MTKTTARRIFNTVLVILILIPIGMFEVNGYNNYKNNCTEKFYSGKIIYKHQAMSTGKYPSERRTFVIKFNGVPKTYTCDYISVETWYRFNEGDFISMKLSPSEAENLGGWPQLFFALWILFNAVIIIISVVLFLSYITDPIVNLYKKCFYD